MTPKPLPALRSCQLWMLLWLLALVPVLARAADCPTQVASVTLDDGLAMEYSQAGQGPVVLLLHGLFGKAALRKV